MVQVVPAGSLVQGGGCLYMDGDFKIRCDPGSRGTEEQALQEAKETLQATG